MIVQYTVQYSVQSVLYIFTLLVVVVSAILNLKLVVINNRMRRNPHRLVWLRVKKAGRVRLPHPSASLLFPFQCQVSRRSQRQPFSVSQQRLEFLDSPVSCSTTNWRSWRAHLHRRVCSQSSNSRAIHIQIKYTLILNKYAN